MNDLSLLSKQKDSRDLSISSIKLNFQKKHFKKIFERKINSYKDSKNISNNKQFRKVSQKISKSSSMNDIFPSHYYFLILVLKFLKNHLKKYLKKIKLLNIFYQKVIFIMNKCKNI